MAEHLNFICILLLNALIQKIAVGLIREIFQNSFRISQILSKSVQKHSYSDLSKYSYILFLRPNSISSSFAFSFYSYWTTKMQLAASDRPIENIPDSDKFSPNKLRNTPTVISESKLRYWFPSAWGHCFFFATMLLLWLTCYSLRWIQSNSQSISNEP